LRPPTEYFLAAIETLRANKARYAQAEALARVRRPSRPQWFTPSFMADEAVAALAGEDEGAMSVGFTTFATAVGGMERYDGP
jgi:hypothetical protein